MKFATWIVRGFGTVNKKSMVRNIIREEGLDIIGLTETKHQEITRWDMKKCWGNQEVDWMHVTARQGSGGLVISWKQAAFTLSNSIAMSRWVCVIGMVQEIQTPCAFCLVYAPSNHQERLVVWDQLRAIKVGFGVP